jgi:signal transduction histidine kinase
MFNSLRARLFVVNLGLIVLGFGSLTLWAGQQMAQTTWDDYGSNQYITSLLLANQLVEPLEENPARAQTLLLNSAENLSAQLALFDPNGNLIYATGEPMLLVSSGAYVVQDGLVQTSAAIIYENQRIGYVQLATSAAKPQDAIHQRWLGLGGAFAAFSLVGTIITAWLLNTLTQPLAHLRDSALQIADGALDHRITDLPRNEIGAVGSAFNAMAEQVTALIDEQRAFASNASHELRTPLTTIRLRTEALARGVEPTVQTQYIEEIDSESQRLSRLVEDLLLLSRLDAHRLQAGTEQIDVAHLLHALKRQMAPAAAQKAVTLQVAAPDEPLLIAASLSHAQIVFRNVLDNALKFSSAPSQVAVTLSRDGAYAVVTVVDSGRGISAENLPHIGKRFYRTDKARNRQTPGTGLGLALVQSILTLYSGQFDIDSAGIGHGTRVTIRWPLV